MMRGPIQVPVVLDNLENNGAESGISAKFSRCYFFAIDSPDQTSDWILLFNQNVVPYIQFSLSGVIYSPIVQTNQEWRHFSHPGEIESLFDLLESTADFLVSTGSIYLPTKTLRRKSPNNKLAANSVFRIKEKVFRLAVDHARGHLPNNDYSAQMEKATTMNSIAYSPDETKAFGVWAIQQMEAMQQGNAPHSELDQPGEF